MKMRTSVFLLGMVVILLCPCTGCMLFHVAINGYSDSNGPKPLPQTSLVLLENPNAENPILEREVLRKLAIALSDRGYQVVPATADEQPDFAVIVGYGMGPPSQRTSAMPRVSGGGSTTVTTMNPNGTMATSTVQIPYSTQWVPVSVTQYSRWMNIHVLDMRAFRASKEVRVAWIGNAVSTGRTGDLRQVLSYMILPLVDRVGEDTGKAFTVTMPSADARVKALDARAAQREQR